MTKKCHFVDEIAKGALSHTVVPPLSWLLSHHIFGHIYIFFPTFFPAARTTDFMRKSQNQCFYDMFERQGRL